MLISGASESCAMNLSAAILPLKQTPMMRLMRELNKRDLGKLALY